MYNDYFYNEEPKSVDIFPGISHQRKSLKYETDPIKKKTRKKKQKTSIGKSSKTMLQAKQQFPDIKTRRQFESSNKNLQGISTGCQSILKSVDLIRNFVLIFGVALFALNKYLKAREDSFDPKYVPASATGGTSTDTISTKSTGHVSENGLRLIMNQEGGFHAKAYKVKGEKYYTIGYGDHGPHVHADDVITEAEARKRLMKKVTACENDVKKRIKVPLTQNMFDALVSLAYNMGSLAPAETLVKKLNAGDYKGAAEAFKLYNKGKEGGKVIEYAGLTKRRKLESDLFSKDISSDNKPKVAETVAHTSSGNINRLANGTMLGGYKMYNPAAQRKYIDLSDRAAAYLKDVGGSGIVTSGAEGKHGKGKTISHGLGNKIDVVANKNTDEGWADLAIPFIQNKNTAYVNFEDFSNDRFNRIKAIIYKKRPDLKAKCESAVQYSFDKKKRFIFNYYTGGGLHLDIGILPNAYSKSSYKEEEAQKAKQLKQQQQKIKQQEQQNKKQTTQPANTTQNKSNKTQTKTVNAPNKAQNKNNTTYKNLGDVHSAQTNYNNEQAKIKKGK